MINRLWTRRTVEKINWKRHGRKEGKGTNKKRWVDRKEKAKLIIKRMSLKDRESGVDKKNNVEFTIKKRLRIKKEMSWQKRK